MEHKNVCCQKNWIFNKITERIPDKREHLKLREYIMISKYIVIDISLSMSIHL